MPAVRTHRRATVLAVGLAVALLSLWPSDAAARRNPRYYVRKSRWSYVFHLGVNTHLRYFAGVAQIALLRNYAREHYGLVQLAFFSNRGKRAYGLLQFAGWNALRGSYFAVQAGGLNQIKEMFAVVQVGGLNEAGMFVGGAQLGAVNDVGHIAAALQAGVANFVDRDSYVLAQVGGLNWVSRNYTDLWTIAQLGVANIFDGRSELYALLQASLYNSSEDDTSAVLAQVGVINRLTEGTFRGLFQIGAAINAAENFTGIAQAGPYNYVGDRLYGAQLGVVNLAREVNGAQIGLFNYARTLHGVQLGLINISRHGGLPFCVIGNIGF